MKSAALAFGCLALVAASVFAADYDKTEQTPLYILHLKAPAAAMAIPPVKGRILALYQGDAEETKKEAQDDKDGNPDFHPYQVDTVWRITFESPAVLSLSAETYADTGGAHPNGAFQTLVWDKQAGRAVPIEALFAPDQTKAALTAIADAAAKAWVKAYTQRSGDKPDADLPGDAIGPDPDKLKNYALTYAKARATPTASSCSTAPARPGPTCSATSACRSRPACSRNSSRRSGRRCLRRGERKGRMVGRGAAWCRDLAQSITT